MQFTLGLKPQPPKGKAPASEGGRYTRPVPMRFYSGTQSRVMWGSISNLCGAEADVKVKEVSSPEARTEPKRTVRPGAVDA
jgi:hypothetical protein